MSEGSRWLTWSVIGVLLAPAHIWAEGESPRPTRVSSAGNRSAPKQPLAPPRFTFKINPKTPPKDLLPIPPKTASAFGSFRVEKLTDVPEVQFQAPHLLSLKKEDLDKLEEIDKLSQEERNRLLNKVMEQRERFLEQTAHQITKINHLNQKKMDYFMEVLCQQRPDLAGLPWIMGDACRLSKDRSARFAKVVNQLRTSIQLGAGVFWLPPPMLRPGQPQAPSPSEQPPTIPTIVFPVARVAALMQMLAPEPAAMRLALVKHLAGIPQEEATRALTRLAVFSFEKEVRHAALDALQARDAKGTTDILLQGLRYPWPAVAQHTSAAVIQLKRKDLIPHLVDFLDEPDPRDPVVKEFNQRKAPVVRELVRINHHRNCLLCHAPGNTPDVLEEGRLARPREDIVTGSVPIPGEPLPSPFEGYRFQTPDILVRVDVTYLRQDFSLLLPVANAAPWPTMQRFDFLVRTRALSVKEAEAFRELAKKRGPGYLSPNHQAALAALRELTGREAEPNAAAWRSALGISRKQ